MILLYSGGVRRTGKQCVCVCLLIWYLYYYIQEEWKGWDSNANSAFVFSPPLLFVAQVTPALQIGGGKGTMNMKIFGGKRVKTWTITVERDHPQLNLRLIGGEGFCRFINILKDLSSNYVSLFGASCHFLGPVAFLSIIFHHYRSWPWLSVFIIAHFFFQPFVTFPGMMLVWQ